MRFGGKHLRNPVSNGVCSEVVCIIVLPHNTQPKAYALQLQTSDWFLLCNVLVSFFILLLPKVGRGYVFTAVCLSVNRISKLWTDSNETLWTGWVCDKE